MSQAECSNCEDKNDQAFCASCRMLKVIFEEIGEGHLAGTVSCPNDTCGGTISWTASYGAAAAELNAFKPKEEELFPYLNGQYDKCGYGPAT